MRVTPQEALWLQHLQLMGDAGGGSQADRVTDLADARRIAAALHGVLDHLQGCDAGEA